MTTEEKAKAYDEAIKVLHKYDGANIMFTQDLKEEMFPELKEEPEDERIRKELINFLENVGVEELKKIPRNIKEWFTWLKRIGRHEPMTDDFENELAEICNQLLSEVDAEWMNNEIVECIGTSQWLKLCNNTAKQYKDGLLQLVKQDEQPKKHDVCDNCDQQGSCVSPCPMKLVEKQGELTKINPSEFDSQLNRLLKQFETLPKEELASSLSFYLNVVQNGAYKEEKQVEQKPTEVRTTGYWNVQDIEQKPTAWSVEDMNRINRLIAYFEDKESFTAEDDVVYANWLKSLKDRYTWKPSEEQMRVLDLAIRCGINRGTTEETTLVSLFNNLKKLKS